MKAETRADAMAPTAAVPHRQHLVIGAVRTASSRTGLVLVVLAGERWCGASDLSDRSVISDQGAARTRRGGKAAMCDCRPAAILRVNGRLPAVSQFAAKT